jgi:hypothetical protein
MVAKSGFSCPQDFPSQCFAPIIYLASEATSTCLWLSQCCPLLKANQNLSRYLSPLNDYWF